MMRTTVDDLSASLNDVALSHDGARSTRSNLASFQHTLDGLSQKTEAVILHAQAFEFPANDGNKSDGIAVKDALFLHEQTKELRKIAADLANTAQNLTESVEQAIVQALVSLGSHSTSPWCSKSLSQRLLSHFDAQIRAIVQTVLSDTKSRDVLWRAAEECYAQAVSWSGSLHADNYFIPLEEAQLGLPYDADFESEAYYEHENRLDVDKSYAEVFQMNETRKSEARRMERQSWIDFWFSVLNAAPKGPTLFAPPADLHGKSVKLDVPKYLFRVYDDASSGQNDENVIASLASTKTSQPGQRIDILSKGEQEAAELLHLHLNKPLFSGDNEDDLMSWSSSLLFIIQYAIYRAHKGGRPPSGIKICAVDTSKFPHGQFMRDIPLLETYSDAAAQIGGELHKFFNLRLRREEYYNGEFVSQGRVNHGRRSCTMSLRQLINTGLYELYPDFQDPTGKHLWAKRARDLRWSWAEEQTTRDREIELALNIGRVCFSRFDAWDIATLVLTLRSRKMVKCAREGDGSALEKRMPRWADKPVEVTRYWTACDAIRASQDGRAEWEKLFADHRQILRDIFG